jgi:hypothetical protein
VSPTSITFRWFQGTFTAVLLYGKITPFSKFQLNNILFFLFTDSKSQFIPVHVCGEPLSLEFYDWVTFCRQEQQPPDYPSCDLALLIARVLQASAYVQSHVLSDGRQRTSQLIQQLLETETQFANWESTLPSTWRYRTKSGVNLPAKAVFNGEIHIYPDMWVARVWNHYRWARLLLNQLLLDLVNKFPMSSLPLFSVVQRDQTLRTIRQVARDTLVSAPSHWRHPLLDQQAAIPVETAGAAGAGAAGIPQLLFHLKVAACAPGVPIEYWEWTVSVMECIWSDLGMLHARSMLEVMRAHQDIFQREAAEGILTHDE